jgi:hypothetical protein
MISLQTGAVRKVPAPGTITALAWPAHGGLLVMVTAYRSGGHIWRRHDDSRGTWEALSGKSENYGLSWIAAGRDGATLAAVRYDDMMPVVTWIGNLFGRPGSFAYYNNVVLIHVPR